MKKINGIATTEKGVLKNAVRADIASKALALASEALGEVGFEVYEDRKAIALVYEDKNGTKVYATFALTVGTKAPDEKAVKKSGTKKTGNTEVIEID